MHPKSKTPRDGSAHPVHDDESDIRYYHTVTAATSSSRGAMTKVMDIFRKPHVPQPLPAPSLSEEDKKEKKKEKVSKLCHRIGSSFRNFKTFYIHCD